VRILSELEFVSNTECSGLRFCAEWRREVMFWDCERKVF
jgi:hypothetical protein